MSSNVMPDLVELTTWNSTQTCLSNMPKSLIYFTTRLFLENMKVIKAPGTLNTHQSNLWPSDSIVSVKEAKYIWLADSSPGTGSSRRNTPRRRLRSYPIWGCHGPTDCFYERGLSVSFAYVWQSRRTIITCISLQHWSLQFIYLMCDQELYDAKRIDPFI